MPQTNGSGFQNHDVYQEASMGADEGDPEVSSLNQQTIYEVDHPYQNAFD